MSLKAKLDVYPLENYTQTSVDISAGNGGGGGGVRGNEVNLGGGGGGGSASSRPKTAVEKLLSLKTRCEEEPCVRSVEGVLLVHLHRHPHIVVMKQTNMRTRDADGMRTVPPSNTNAEVAYRLPGGRCRRGEAEESCLLRKLGRHLLNEAKAPAAAAAAANAGSSDTVVDVGMSHNTSKAGSCFRVGEVLATWYRPHFTPHMYPYVPAHIAANSVRELRTIFLVHLEPTVYFNMVQDGVQLVAAPLFDLYENTSKYGPIVASLPVLLSRVLINYCSTEY
ncbi:Nucleotide hydrolase [Novymonas esmeraldas]|uniref:Cleavage and polyadenylation specificity factor subunit 5 n=1 Tax=Novymonas esmeraldas TaxID=1808958 RepID=A0AAW0F658_9TRYP